MGLLCLLCEIDLTVRVDWRHIVILPGHVCNQSAIRMLVLKEWTIARWVWLSLNLRSWGMWVERSCHVIAILWKRIYFGVSFVFRKWVTRVVDIHCLVTIGWRIELMWMCCYYICLSWTLRVYHECLSFLTSKILILLTRCRVLHIFWSIWTVTFCIYIFECDSSSVRKSWAFTSCIEIVLGSLS